MDLISLSTGFSKVKNEWMNIVYNVTASAKTTESTTTVNNFYSSNIQLKHPIINRNTINKYIVRFLVSNEKERFWALFNRLYLLRVHMARIQQKHKNG